MPVDFESISKSPNPPPNAVADITVAVAATAVARDAASDAREAASDARDAIADARDATADARDATADHSSRMTSGTFTFNIRPPLPFDHIAAASAAPNSEHFTSFAPSICRAKSYVTVFAAITLSIAATIRSAASVQPM